MLAGRAGGRRTKLGGGKGGVDGRGGGGTAVSVQRRKEVVVVLVVVRRNILANLQRQVQLGRRCNLRLRRQRHGAQQVGGEQGTCRSDELGNRRLTSLLRLVLVNLNRAVAVAVAVAVSRDHCSKGGKARRSFLHLGMHRRGEGGARLACRTKDFAHFDVNTSFGDGVGVVVAGGRGAARRQRNGDLQAGCEEDGSDVRRQRHVRLVQQGVKHLARRRHEGAVACAVLTDNKGSSAERLAHAAGGARLGERPTSHPQQLAAPVCRSRANVDDATGNVVHLRGDEVAGTRGVEAGQLDEHAKVPLKVGDKFVAVGTAQADGGTHKFVEKVARLGPQRVLHQLLHQGVQVLRGHQAWQKGQGPQADRRVVVVQAGEDDVAMFGHRLWVHLEDATERDQPEVLEILVRVFDEQAQLGNAQLHQGHVVGTPGDARLNALVHERHGRRAVDQRRQRVDQLLGESLFCRRQLCQQLHNANEQPVVGRLGEDAKEDGRKRQVVGRRGACEFTHHVAGRRHDGGVVVDELFPQLGKGRTQRFGVPKKDAVQAQRRPLLDVRATAGQQHQEVGREVPSEVGRRNNRQGGKGNAGLVLIARVEVFAKEVGNEHGDLGALVKGLRGCQVAGALRPKLTLAHYLDDAKGRPRNVIAHHLQIHQLLYRDCFDGHVVRVQFHLQLVQRFGNKGRF
mmetsp:Transcript_11019/g.34967  ORF Transcript_11019/g.34967 Transcript_11019/m.34967 type:complete len:681 (-) Transcript_11019:135-2177(-)